MGITAEETQPSISLPVRPPGPPAPPPATSNPNAQTRTDFDMKTMEYSADELDERQKTLVEPPKK